MATQLTATTPRTRPAPPLGVLGVAILAVIAVAVIGVAVEGQAGSTRDVTIESRSYGVGYPLHGGLAGPSRVGQGSTVAGPNGPLSTLDLAGHYGRGYPLHGGLAGPSEPMSTVDLAGHYGAGYPLHGGLAGPSRVDSGK
ncbi:MAG TPA: hypothetical protein VHK63_04495 [Candidatus Limnocylindria bacterium]|nr:hypothetical protein [Candidatus Limnocylindria bacterium]